MRKLARLFRANLRAIKRDNRKYLHKKSLLTGDHIEVLGQIVSSFNRRKFSVRDAKEEFLRR